MRTANLAAGSALAALAVLTPTAPAQLDLEWSDGILGSQIVFDLHSPGGAPLFGLLVSFQVGPTPLALIDPSDPRQLDVGLDLFSLATFGGLGSTGEGSVALPLPPAPALVGRPLFAQGLTLPGAAQLVDAISNPVGLVLGLPGNSYPALTDDLLARRFASTATDSEGRVLVLGGEVPSASVGIQVTDAVSVFDPQTQRYTPAGFGLPQPQGRAKTVAIGGGRVLLVGGIGPNGATTTCSVVDVEQRTAVATGALAVPRVFPSAHALPDGRVLVVGGSADFTPGHPIGWPASVQTALATSEIWDPATGLWSSGPSLPRPTTMLDSAVLGTGEILMVGGVALPPQGQFPITSSAAYLFEPTTGQLATTAPLPGKRMHTGTSPTAFGDAMVIGGAEIDFGTLSTAVKAEGWLFSASSKTWAPLPDAPGLIRCGQLTCVENEIKIYYLMGMGLSSLDLATGAATYDQRFFQLDASLSTWVVDGSSRQAHMGGSFVPVDGGLRALIVGPGDATAFDAGLPQRLAEVAELLIPERPGC